MNSTTVNTSGAPRIKCEAAPAILLTNCDSGGTVLAETMANDNAMNTYNLNVNVNLNAAVSSLLAAESACTTPRTPEILNSVIAMTNPLDQYNNTFNGSEKCATAGYKSGSGNDSNSSMSNGSSATSPASGTPPSIQKTCSELIKAGLKLSIESKRKMSGSECSDAGLGCVKRLKKEESDDDYDSSHTQNSKSELTPEDEERRRRRRERNKIAATKCRLKKRERTHNLVTESEVLETQNIDLKTQLKDLEVQRRQLIDMLSLHKASCIKNTSTTSPTTPFNMIRPYDSPTPYPATYDTSSPYLRPESANILASSYTCSTVEPSMENMSSIDSHFMTHHLIENEYQRPDSVLSVPVSSDMNFGTTDGYIPKATNLLVIENPECEYYEPEVYHLNMSQQQCHNYNNGSESQAKMNSGLNNGCLA